MVDFGRQRIFKADLFLHKALAKRNNLLFLQRNLRHVLESHENLLRKGDETLHEDMIASERRTAGWDFPTPAMLRELMQGQKPVLQIHSLQLRHSGAKRSATQRSGLRNDEADGFDWLPDPAIDCRLPCTVGVTVLDTRTSKRSVYVESRPATITRSHKEAQHPLFDIELGVPFLIELNKLFVVVDSGSNGRRRYKRTVTAEYMLEVTIQCQDSDDTAELLSRLENRDASSYQSAPWTEGVLKATWKSLPECPKKGHLLGLRRPKGHKSLDLDYGVDVEMGWLRRQDSPLTTYNKELIRLSKPSRQLPTPSASDDLEKVPKQYAITYNYVSGHITRTCTVQGLRCPICVGGREYPYFAQLKLHCLRYHDHFTFDQDQTQNMPDSAVIRMTVWIALAEEPYEHKAQSIGSSKKERVELNWTAPARPFNVSAYVNGEDDWIAQGNGLSKPKGQRGRPPKHKEKDITPVVAPQPTRKRPALEDVEDLPEPKRAMHRVPDVPGLRFYRTKSKKILPPGEYVAESDEEVDESWLDRSQSRGLDDLGCTGAAKDFNLTFDRHLASEQSGSSVLMREALVRFVRNHRAKLADLEWQKYFRAKLNKLRGAQIVNDDVVTYCVRELQAATKSDMLKDSLGGSTAGGAERDASEVENGFMTNGNGLANRQRKKWVDGKFMTTLPNGSTSPEKHDSPHAMESIVNGYTRDGTIKKDGALTPVSLSSSDRAKPIELCICGDSAERARGAFTCSASGCVRKHYHLACVGLERRVPGWRCRDCST